MNFQEYLNQKDPAKFPRVEIVENDCVNIADVSAYPNCRKIISLEFWGTVYSYLLSTTDNLLRTMDDHGNPKNISCFIWKGKP